MQYDEQSRSVQPIQTDFVKRAFVIVLVVLVLTIALLFSGIPLRLDFLESRLAVITGEALDRPVNLQGPVRLRLSLHPELEIENLTIGSPTGWQGSTPLLEVGRARAKISLRPLLEKQVSMDRVELDEVDVRLVTRTDHSTNFSFSGTTRAESDSPHAALSRDAEQDESTWEIVSLDTLALRDIRIAYQDELSGRSFTGKVDSANGQATRGDELQLSVAGSFEELPYTLDIHGGTLNDLLTGPGPWPLEEGKLTLAELTLDVAGAIGVAEDTGSGYMRLSIRGDNAEAVAEAFGVDLPAIGGFSLSGRLAAAPGELSLSGLRVYALDTSLDGDLVLSLQGPRPILAGTLQVPVLDAAVWPSGESESSSGTDKAEQLSDTMFTKELPLDFLSLVDSDLRLDIDALMITPGAPPLQDLELKLSLIDGDLVAPFSFKALESTIRGQIDVLTDSDMPEAVLQLHTSESQIDLMLQGSKEKPGFGGTLGAVTLRADARGKRIVDLWSSLAVDLSVGSSRIETADGPLLGLQQGSLRHLPDEPTEVSLLGELLGAPLRFETRIGQTGAMPTADEPILTLDVTACDSDLDFGVVRQGEGESAVILLDYQLSGERFCGFLQPIASFLEHDPQITVTGSGEIRRGRASFGFDTLALDDIHADGEIRLINLEGSANPVIEVDIHSEHLDLQPLLSKAETAQPVFTPAVAPELKNQAAQAVELLDRNFIPQGLSLGDSTTLNLHIERISTGTGDISDLRLTAEIDEGRLKEAPFSLTAAEHKFNGDLQIDLTKETPEVGVEVHANALDLTRLLTGFGVEGAPDLTSDRVDLGVTLRGGSIRQLVKQSEFNLSASDGELIVPRALSPPLHITVSSAQLGVGSGQPLHLALEGGFDGEPYSVNLKGKGLLGVREGVPLTLNLEVRLSDTELALRSALQKEKEKEKEKGVLALTASLSGQRLDDLNALLGLDLPPLNAYRIEGTLNLKEGEVSIRDLELETGQSSLKGELVLTATRLDTGETGLPIHADLNLAAPVVQLDDFYLHEWLVSAGEGESADSETPEVASGEHSTDVEEPAGSLPEVEVSEEVSTADSRVQLNSLLSPEIAKMMEAKVRVDIDQTLSGQDVLGSGHIKANLSGGVYSLDRFQINIPGGTINISGSLKPGTNAMDGHLIATIDNLDYGVLARRAVPDTDLKGEFNLEIDLSSQAADLAAMKSRTSGHVRVAVIPEELQAGIVDLWAVNVVAMVLPVMMKGSSSEVNCLVGDFTLKDGLMYPEVLMLDTSKMRVEGKGTIDFGSNMIDLHFKPKPKSPQFFSLATPVSVTGSLTEPSVGVSATGVIGTVFGFASSVITTPFKKIFSKRLDADGAAACAEAMDWVHSPDRIQEAMDGKQ